MKKRLVCLQFAILLSMLFCSCREECGMYHRFNKETVKEQTCTEDGLIKKTCRDCGYVEEEVIGAEHDFDQQKVIEEATCSENGLALYKCVRCGETEERETAKKSCERRNFRCINCGDYRPMSEHDIDIGDSQFDVKWKWGEPLDVDKSTSEYSGTQEIWWYKDNGNTIMVDFDADGNVEYISW